jgi:hypothetical protein
VNWLRSNYDRAAVLAGALFLLVCAILIYINTSSFGQNTTAAVATAPQKQPPPLGHSGELQDAIQKLGQPAQWTFSGRSGLFVPERHFIGANALPATLESSEIHPPVPNEWFEQFSLPITEADILTQDADTDGFNNLEEWEGHTNPTDKDSHPSFLAKLKMKSFKQEPFRLMFSSMPGPDTFAINTIDLNQPTQFVKLGETIRGTKFKVVKFTDKHAPDKYGTEVDMSEIVLQNEQNGEQLTLVKEKVTTSPESVASFVYLWGGQKEFTVKKDEEFSLPPQQEIKYKLIDVQPDKAVVVNTQKPNEKIEIGLLKP